MEIEVCVCVLGLPPFVLIYLSKRTIIIQMGLGTRSAEVVSESEFCPITFSSVGRSSDTA
jgi:hypothetical protein